MRVRRLLRSRPFLWGVILGVLCASAGREIPKVLPDLFSQPSGLVIGSASTFMVGDPGSIVVYDSTAGVWSSISPPVPPLPLSTAADQAYAADLAAIASLTFIGGGAPFRDMQRECDHWIVTTCLVGGCNPSTCELYRCFNCGVKLSR